jgi:A/G-specific adenine glycosylase
VLIAELMLHRTQVAQVTPVYSRFMASFPNLETLASAPKRRVAAHLRNLGLQWRIDLIPEVARTLVADFNGTIPRNKDVLCGLPGISDYIASAVRCFAFDHPEALMDTNTVRIVGRLFGLPIKDSSRRNPTFKQALSQLLDRKNPKAYNYALIDHAHAVCRKKKPVCEICPLARWCVFGGRELQERKCVARVATPREKTMANLKKGRPFDARHESRPKS